MDASQLATLMLSWETLRQKMDGLETEIKKAVLEIGKTQTVGNVRASFRNGRKSYQYQDAADGHLMVSDVTVSLFTETKTVTTVDWRGICKHAGIDDVPFTQGKPSVTLKLLT